MKLTFVVDYCFHFDYCFTFFFLWKLGMDGMGRSPPSIMGLQHCHGHGNNQLLRLNAAGQLGVGQYILFKLTSLPFSIGNGGIFFTKILIFSN